MRKQFFLIMSMLCVVGSIMPATQSHEPALARRIADYPLWLDHERHEDRVVYLPMPLAGTGRSFVETGLYDVSGFAKWAKLYVGVPLCTSCMPRGITASLDIETYVNNGPFWVGVRDLGGGFVHHRHVQGPSLSTEHWSLDQWEGNPSRVGLAQRYTEQFMGKIQSPAAVVGKTLAGQWGCWDSVVGIKPYLVNLNGGVMPTLHTQFFAQSYAYTPPAQYGPFRGRLFVGVEACATDNAVNKEWGVAVLPGSSLRALFGVQVAVEGVRAGLAYGGMVRTASMHSVENELAYVNRLKQYQELARFYEQEHDDTAPPVQLDGALRAGVFTGYLGGVWGRYTCGFAFQTEVARNAEQPLTSSVRFGLGYSF